MHIIQHVLLSKVLCVIITTKQLWNSYQSLMLLNVLYIKFNQFIFLVSFSTLFSSCNALLVALWLWQCPLLCSCEVGTTSNDCTIYTSNMIKSSNCKNWLVLMSLQIQMTLCLVSCCCIWLCVVMILMISQSGASIKQPWSIIMGHHFCYSIFYLNISKRSLKQIELFPQILAFSFIQGENYVMKRQDGNLFTLLQKHPKEYHTLQALLRPNDRNLFIAVVMMVNQCYCIKGPIDFFIMS